MCHIYTTVTFSYTATIIYSTRHATYNIQHYNITTYNIVQTSKHRHRISVPVRALRSAGWPALPPPGSQGGVAATSEGRETRSQRADAPNSADERPVAIAVEVPEQCNRSPAIRVRGAACHQSGIKAVREKPPPIVRCPRENREADHRDRTSARDPI